MARVHTFLVERHWPGVTHAMFEAAVARITAAERELRGAGPPVHYLGSTLLPSDESVFCVFEADDQCAVAELSAHAGFPYDRLLPASVSSQKDLHS